MKTESLAVKYRPKVLTDLVGQDHIVSQVKGMLKTKRVPASIMLAGPTGLGKTTTARMLARYLNCSNLTKEFEPCGECVNCKMTDHPDVFETNAANSRGIDDVRQLIQQSKNMPTLGKKRVIIVDEAHQLPSLSQQALLKPLEDSSEHTLWIICTMTPEKMVPAIAKRCLILQVKPVEPELIVKRLYRIAKREGVDFKTMDEGVKILKTIADFANGGMRDAVRMLESVLYAFNSGEEVDPKTVLTKFLSGGEADLEQSACNVLCAVLKKDLKGLLKETQGCENVRGVLNKLRWLIDYLLSNSVGKAKFIPYSGRLFSKQCKDNDIKVSLIKLIGLQSLLLDVEFRFNSMSIDERVVFTSMVGNFLSQE